MGVLGGTEDQAGGKGAQGRFQADGLGHEAAERQHHEGRHHDLTRGLELVEQPVEARGRGAAQKKGRRHKNPRCCHQLEDRAQTEALATGQAHHHGQDHDAEDVIEYGRADHGLPLAGAQKLQLAEHTGGDADAGGGHRRPGENRRNQGHIEEVIEARSAQGKGQHHAGHCHRGGLGTHRH